MQRQTQTLASTPAHAHDHRKTRASRQVRRKEQQKERLKERRVDPLSQWKSSPIDAVAVKHWEDYSAARDEMLMRTHTMVAPWTIVRADDKPAARINLIRDLLTRLEFKGKDRHGDLPDPEIVFSFHMDAISNGTLAK